MTSLGHGTCADSKLTPFAGRVPGRQGGQYWVSIDGRPACTSGSAARTRGCGESLLQAADSRSPEPPTLLAGAPECSHRPPSRSRSARLWPCYRTSSPGLDPLRHLQTGDPVFVLYSPEGPTPTSQMGVSSCNRSMYLPARWSFLKKAVTASPIRLGPPESALRDDRTRNDQVGRRARTLRPSDRAPAPPGPRCPRGGAKYGVNHSVINRGVWEHEA